MTRLTKTLFATLMISVLANFAAFGFIGVRVAKDYVYHSVLDDANSTKEVPQEFRAAFSNALRDNRWELLKGLRELRISRDTQQSVLTAETFDSVALTSAQQKVRVATIQLINILQNAIGIAADSIPDEVRRSVPKFKVGQQTTRYLKEAAKERH